MDPNTQNIPPFSFIHLADAHLGSWRNEKLRELGMRNFTKAISYAITQKVSFVIIAGDLFNTALPSFEILREVVAQLQTLKEAQIPCYYVAGSHDYSSAGKSMLHILSEAKLAVDVQLLQIVENSENNTTKNPLLQLTPVIHSPHVALQGIMGRQQSLEKQYFVDLDRESINLKSPYNIFLFHTTIQELKPAEFAQVEGVELSLLPKGFSYYAGGHVHYRFCEDIPGYGKVVYPGPVFPNNFAELEKLRCGSFVKVTVANNTTNAEYVLLDEISTDSYSFDCTNKSPDDVTTQLLNTIKPTHNIITIRISGTLREGHAHDIDFKKMHETFADSYAILQNTTKVESKETHILKTQLTDNIEEKTIGETLPDATEQQIAKTLLTQLHTVKQDGEVAKDFEERIINEARNILFPQTKL